MLGDSLLFCWMVYKPRLREDPWSILLLCVCEHVMLPGKATVHVLTYSEEFSVVQEKKKK